MAFSIRGCGRAAALHSTQDPHLFLAEYKTEDGETVHDDAEEFIQWLEDNPDATLEIITNSVLTSDNFPAQSVIDMETSPRLYMPPEMREQPEAEGWVVRPDGLSHTLDETLIGLFAANWVRAQT